MSLTTVPPSPMFSVLSVGVLTLSEAFVFSDVDELEISDGLGSTEIFAPLF